MKFYPSCDYFGDERDSEFAPGHDNCEGCYRYEICKAAYEKEVRNNES